MLLLIKQPNLDETGTFLKEQNKKKEHMAVPLTLKEEQLDVPLLFNCIWKL